MNRAARRAAQNGAGQPAARAVTMQHGHSETHVVVILSAPVRDLVLTVEQTDALIASLTNSKEKLLEHLKRKPREPANG